MCVCTRKRKRQSNSLKVWKTEYSCMQQSPLIYTNTHAHTQSPSCLSLTNHCGSCSSFPLQSSPRGSHKHLPTPAIFSLRDYKSQRPLGVLITASILRPTAFIFSVLDLHLLCPPAFKLPPDCPSHLSVTGSGNILGNAKQRKSSTQKQALTQQTTKQLASVWSGWNNHDLSGNTSSPPAWDGSACRLGSLKVEKHNS